MKGCWTEGILMGELDPVSGRLGGLKYDSTSSKSPIIQNCTLYILSCVTQAGLHQRLPRGQLQQHLHEKLYCVNKNMQRLAKAH